MMNLRSFFALLLSGLLLLAAPARAEDPALPGAAPEFTEFSELSGKTVSMLTGAPFEEMVSSFVPDASFTYYGSMADMLMALKAGKTDAVLNNNAVAELAVNKDSGLALFPKQLKGGVFGYAFAKGDPRRDEWQAALDRIPAETVTELWNKWTGSDEDVKHVPEQDWPGANGTVQAAVCDVLEPIGYVGKDGKLLGFDVELILLMARELDVHVAFTGMDLAAVLSSVQAGRALIGGGSIIATDERKEIMDFVEYHPAGFVLVVRSAGGGAAGGYFWTGLAGSFERTFIRDDRYRIVLSGLGLTLLMSLVSGAAGLALAWLLVLARSRNIRWVNALISALESLVAGVPAVVILMVFYYILFGKSSLPAAAVAIIGFTVIFATRACGVIWNAAGAVDSGQREASLALGYTEEMAFRKVILPQSWRISEPTLQAQAISLLKETSVAGYITVVELTRAGDLIRGRTLEAFFPLIATALIYFALTRLMALAGKQAMKAAARRREARTVKGVD